MEIFLYEWKIMQKSLYKTCLPEPRNYFAFYQDGERIKYYKNGNVKEKIIFNKDLPDGFYRKFYPNGQLKIEGSFENGLEIGIWNFYDENKNIIRKVFYNKKEIVLAKIENYYVSGKIQSKGKIKIDDNLAFWDQDYTNWRHIFLHLVDYHPIYSYKDIQPHKNKLRQRVPCDYWEFFDENGKLIHAQNINALINSLRSWKNEELKKMHATIKEDKFIVTFLVNKDPHILEYVSKKLKKDKEIVLAAIKRYSYLFEYADDSLKKDKEIVLAAVTNDGYALKYADINYKNDREFILIAVNNNAHALNFIEERFKTDDEIILTCLLYTI